MRAATGQHLMGAVEGGKTHVWTIRTTSELQSGDIKAWIVRWDPKAGTVEIVWRFRDGEISAPWRLMDFYDPPGIVRRVEAVIPSSVEDAGRPAWAVRIVRTVFEGAE